MFVIKAYKFEKLGEERQGKDTGNPMLITIFPFDSHHHRSMVCE